MLPGWANTQTTKVNGTPTLSMSILMTFTFSEAHYPVQFTVAMTVAKAVIIECDRNTNWRERIQTLENTCYDQNQGTSECSLDQEAGCLFLILLQTDLDRSLMRWGETLKEPDMNQILEFWLVSQSQGVISRIRNNLKMSQFSLTPPDLTPFFRANN